MTTFANSNQLSAARNHTPPDFVSSDSAALASHMSRCAHGRSRFFGLHAALESVRSLFFSRMVTCVMIAVVAVGVLGLTGIV